MLHERLLWRVPRSLAKLHVGDKVAPNSFTVEFGKVQSGNVNGVSARNDGNTLVVCKFLSRTRACLRSASGSRRRCCRSALDRPFGFGARAHGELWKFRADGRDVRLERERLCRWIDGGDSLGTSYKDETVLPGGDLNRFLGPGASCASGARSERSARSPPSPGARSTTSAVQRCSLARGWSRASQGQPRNLACRLDGRGVERGPRPGRTGRLSRERLSPCGRQLQTAPGGVNWPPRRFKESLRRPASEGQTRAAA